MSRKDKKYCIIIGFKLVNKKTGEPCSLKSMLKEAKFHTRVDGVKVKTLSDSGNNCKYGSQLAIFIRDQISMCVGRVLYIVLVCGNCPYPDPLGADRPKSCMHNKKPFLQKRKRDYFEENSMLQMTNDKNLRIGNAELVDLLDSETRRINALIQHIKVLENTESADKKNLDQEVQFNNRLRQNLESAENKFVDHEVQFNNRLRQILESAEKKLRIKNFN